MNKNTTNRSAFITSEQGPNFPLLSTDSPPEFCEHVPMTLSLFKACLLGQYLGGHYQHH